MTTHTTRPGKTPFSAVERLPNGDILDIVVNCTGKLYCVNMKRWSPDLRDCETILEIVMPIQASTKGTVSS